MCSLAMLFKLSLIKDLTILTVGEWSFYGACRAHMHVFRPRVWSNQEGGEGEASPVITSRLFIGLKKIPNNAADILLDTYILNA